MRNSVPQSADDVSVLFRDVNVPGVAGIRFFAIRFIFFEEFTRNLRGIFEEFVCGIWFCGDSENFYKIFIDSFFAKIERYFELCQFNTHECCPCLKIFYIFAVLSSQHTF